MRSGIFCVAVLLAAQAQAIAVESAAAWNGVKLMPKPGVVVKVGDQEIDAHTIDLPWVVHGVHGKWLLVGEDKKGWVQRDRVVTLEEAPAYYSQLIDSDPSDVNAYTARGLAWAYQHKFDLAIADYDEALRRQPDADTYYNRGIAWAAKKDYVRAIADYDQAVRLDPTMDAAFIARASAWYSQRDNDKSLADCDAAIRLRPTKDRYVSRGRLKCLKKDYDSAIADFNQALRLAPACAETYVRRGHAYRLKMKGDAEKDFDERNAKFGHCSSFARSVEDRAAAIDDFTRAIQLEPKNSMAYGLRGVVRHLWGEYDKAIADYTQAIRLDPSNAYVFAHAAWIRATASDEQYRNGKKAVELATKACELSDWNDKDYLDVLAAAQAEAGDFDAAIRYQNQAVELNPSDDEFMKTANERQALYQDRKPYRDR